MNIIDKITFNIQMWWNKRVVNSVTNNALFTYPLILSLTFERDYYLKRFERKISVRSSVLNKVNIIHKSFLKAFTKQKRLEQNEVLRERYYRFINYYTELQENRQDILDNFGVDLNTFKK